MQKHVNAASETISNIRPLRYGIMCEGYVLQEWQVQCIERLNALDGVQLALLIINDRPRTRTPFTKLRKIQPRRILFQLFMKFLYRPLSVREIDAGGLLAKVPAIRCRPVRGGRFSKYFDGRDLETIRGFKLDFILLFGFGIIRGEILKTARYGVWSFHHDDEEKYRGGPPCFWEIYHGDPVTGAVLQRLTNRLDAGIILKKGFFRTIGYSYARNVDTAYYQSARWPALVCIDIRNGTADYLDSPPSGTKAPVYHGPSNLQMILFVLKLGRNFVRRQLYKFFRHGEWNIGIVHEPIQSFLQPGYKPSIEWLPATPKGEFRADPFGVPLKEGIQIFFENFDYRQSKGIISTAEVRGSTLISKPEVAMTFPGHVSYPYLFEYRGSVFCVPEIFGLREIGVYKAESFPRGWTKVGTLVHNVAAADTTVLYHGGRWWLMYVDRDDGTGMNLFIWYAPDLEGPWMPHAGNPVKSDIRSARPAGTPFVHNGELFRPAQDCSKGYGGRVIVNRVTKLSPTEFKEEPVAVTEPDPKGPYPDGLHTISAVGRVTLVDGKRLTFISTEFRAACRRSLRWILDRQST